MWNYSKATVLKNSIHTYTLSEFLLQLTLVANPDMNTQIRAAFA